MLVRNSETPILCRNTLNIRRVLLHKTPKGPNTGRKDRRFFPEHTRVRSLATLEHTTTLSICIPQIRLQDECFSKRWSVLVLCGKQCSSLRPHVTASTRLFNHPFVVPRVELVRIPASQLFQNHSPGFFGFLSGFQSCCCCGGGLLLLVQALLLVLLVSLSTARKRLQGVTSVRNGY